MRAVDEFEVRITEMFVECLHSGSMSALDRVEALAAEGVPYPEAVARVRQWLSTLDINAFTQQTIARLRAIL